MTLLVALKGKDGLALAADSRGTFGDPRATTAQNDSQRKAHILSKHVAALTAGAGEVGALLIEEVRADLAQDDLDGVTPVMEALRKVAREDYQEWFPSIPAIQPPQLVFTGQVPVRPELSFIVAGFEVDEGEDGEESVGESKMYQLVGGLDFAPMLHEYGFAVAGVAQYALYLLNRLYEHDRTVAELTSLAVYVITETASQDGKVGGPVQVVTITPKDGCRALDAEDVDGVVSGNEGRSDALRSSFYRRRS